MTAAIGLFFLISVGSFYTGIWLTEWSLAVRFFATGFLSSLLTGFIVYVTPPPEK